MFLGTWSLSEAPVDLRKRLAKAVENFDYHLIAYQHHFGDVDNQRFFHRWRRRSSKDIIWQEEAIEHLPGNAYLIGSPKLRSFA